MLSGDSALGYRSFFDSEDGFAGFPIEAENQSGLRTLQNCPNGLAIVLKIDKSRL